MLQELEISISIGLMFLWTKLDILKSTTVTVNKSEIQNVIIALNVSMYEWFKIMQK